MVTRADVVAEARRWKDAPTPYGHQGRMFGVVADCIGMVIGVCRCLGIVEPDFEKTGYAQIPDGMTLKAGCDAHMTRVAMADQIPGHVLLLRFRTEPQHMAIVGDDENGRLTMIHAYSLAGKVIEHRIAPIWRARIVQAYALPGVA